jgi:hypothetical protein
MADEGQPPAQQPTAMSASSIRLPPFWSNSPAAWFKTAEAHFMLRGITDPVEKFLSSDKKRKIYRFPDRL